MQKSALRPVDLSFGSRSAMRRLAAAVSVVPVRTRTVGMSIDAHGGELAQIETIKQGNPN
jgi:hypothetical protein